MELQFTPQCVGGGLFIINTQITSPFGGNTRLFGIIFILYCTRFTNEAREIQQVKKQHGHLSSSLQCDFFGGF